MIPEGPVRRSGQRTPKANALIASPPGSGEKTRRSVGRLRTCASIALACIGLACAESDPERSEYLVVHEIVAEPARIESFERSMRDWVEIVRSHAGRSEHLRFATLASKNGEYLLESVIYSHSDLDKRMTAFQELIERDWDRLTAPGEQMEADTFQYRGEWIVVVWKHVSYSPRGWSCDSASFVRRERFFVLPSSSEAFETTLVSYTILSRERRSPLGFRTKVYMTGPEKPCFELEFCANDEAALEREIEAAEGLLGEEGAALRDRLRKVARRVDRVDLRRRTDLSTSRP